MQPITGQTTTQDVLQFQQLIKEEYQRDVSIEEASRIFIHLRSLYKTLFEKQMRVKIKQKG